MTNKIKLGDLAKDVVTGFEGIVAAKTKWLTSCTSIMLTPNKLDKDGKPMRSEHFDIDRVELVKRGAVKLVKDKPIKEARKTGGPSSLDSYAPER